MKITSIDVVRTKKPIPLPGEYCPAWEQPDGAPVNGFGVAYYRIFTDEGIVGYGPYGAEPDEYVRRCLIGKDPFKTETFWTSAMAGLETRSRGSYGGLDVALWDIIGKAANRPVYQLLGTRADKIKVYAATSRILTAEEHIEQVLHVMSLGFKAVKLRLHRPDWRDDIKTIEAVRKACGDEITIVVDANQNNRSTEYGYWSKETARLVCREMQALGVFFCEEPLKRRDYEGLSSLSKEFDMYIAGGEHAQNIYEFKEHLKYSTYDILQPDLLIGDIGITGLRKLGYIAEYHDKQIVPHVCGMGSFAISFAASAAAMVGLSNCPMLEYSYDPPFMTVESLQFFIKEKFTVDCDGYVHMPQTAGIGIEIDEAALAEYL